MASIAEDRANTTDKKTTNIQTTVTEPLASDSGVENVEKELTAEDVKKDTLLFYRIIEEMPEDTSPARKLAIAKLKKCLQLDKSNIDAAGELQRTALWLAVGKRSSEAVDVLLEGGASAEAGDDYGIRPLHLASALGYEAIVDSILNRRPKSDVNVKERRGFTPLHYACLRGDSKIVRLLLSHQANPDDVDESGKFPLWVACFKGNREIAEQLLVKANPKLRNKSGETALHEACKRGHADIVAILLADERVEISVQDNSGRTPLHTAITHGELDIISKFLTCKVDLEVEDNDGWTALHYAARFSTPEITSMLLKDGNVSMIHGQDKDGSTALHVSSKYGNVGVVDLLLEKGAEVAAKTKAGETALHLASNSENWDEGEDSYSAIIKSLLCRDADLNAKDNNKVSAMDFILKGECTSTFLEVLAHTCAQPVAVENGQVPRKSPNEKLEELLERPELATSLSRLIQEPPKIEGVSETLRLALDLVLDIIYHWKRSKPTTQLPDVLWLLLAASDRDSKVSGRCQIALDSLRDLDAQRLISRLTKEFSDLSALLAEFSTPDNGNDSGKGGRDGEVRSEDAPTNTNHGQTDDGSNKSDPSLSIQLDHHTSQIENLDEEVFNSLYLVRDILRDPPYSQLHTDDYARFKTPEVNRSFEHILDTFESTVVQLYKATNQSGVIRRYRSVREVIYGEGPTKIMADAVRNLDKMRERNLIPKQSVVNAKEEPRFTWIHLPATNMVWMKDLLMRVMTEQECKAKEYYELKSFFQDSWIQVPDGETPSKVMRPRATSRVVSEHLTHHACCDKGTNETVDTEQSSVQSYSSVKDSNEDASGSNVKGTENTEGVPVVRAASGKKMSASAIYMPYLCFSCHYKEGGGRTAIPEAFTNYWDLLKQHESSVIHESPTLDEWYYKFASCDKESRSESRSHREANDDRINRNEDQVVTKFLREQEEVKPGDDYTLLRVNQIWIWVIANKWILSASSCSLDGSHDSLVDGILEELNRRAEYGGSGSQPDSADAMTKIIVDYCVGSYERKPKPNAMMSIGQIFSKYMNSIGRKEADIFNRVSQWDLEKSQDLNQSSSKTITKSFIKSRFKNWFKSDKQDTEQPLPDRTSPVPAVKKGKAWSEEEMRKSTNMTKELFRHIKDVRDELNILKAAVSFQKVVQKQLNNGEAKIADLSASYIENDIREMDEVANRIQVSLNTTLSLQQSEIANLNTRLSLQQSQIANDQARLSADMNKVLMTFTFATLVFLPLSFLSSLFALDADSFLKTPNWVFVVIFLVATVISLIIIAGALSVKTETLEKFLRGPSQNESRKATDGDVDYSSKRLNETSDSRDVKHADEGYTSGSGSRSIWSRLQNMGKGQSLRPRTGRVPDSECPA